MANPAHRRFIIATVVVAALGAGAGVARWWAGQEALRVLKSRGGRWETRQDTLGAVILTDVTLSGVTAKRVTVTLLPAPSVHLDRVDVDAETIVSQPSTAGSSPPSADTALPLPPITIDALTVRWGDDVLGTGWSGTLAPHLSVEGPGGQVSRSPSGLWTADLDRDLSVGPLSGRGTLSVTCATDCTVSLQVPEAVLSHPFLARKPLPGRPLTAEVEWTKESGRVSGQATLGAVEVGLSGQLTQASPTARPTAVQLALTLPDTPLADLVDLFGDHVPEAASADIRGTVGAEATLDWPSGEWSLTPRANDLAVAGAIDGRSGSGPRLDDLSYGTIQWEAPGGDGAPRLRSTGDGSNDWVPLRASGLVPAAVMAAEDAAFTQHEGIDLAAIQEAIEQARTRPDKPVRGGSTLTQQLVKNLLLDTRERTLARKLRELLLAVELDRELPKERILELYLNVVELGPDLYGIGAAAHAYFLKEPARLTAQEAAFLAALLPAPRTLAPRAWQGGRPPVTRMNHILDNMRDLKRITPQEAALAKRTTLRLVPPP